MQSVKDNLLAAFRYLLKPLVRMAIKNGVSFTDFSEALKRAYVDVATKQIAASRMVATEEGISLITNVAANDVGAILRAGDDAEYRHEVQHFSPLPAVLTGWHTDPETTGPYGVLRDLEMTRSVETPYSFTDLANKYCPDFSPRVVMDELVRQGAVQDVGGGFYKAIKRLVVPDPLSATSMLLVARSVHNLCETLEMNLRLTSAGGKGLIERSIFTDYGIPKKDFPAFDKFIRERGQMFSDDIDNWFSDHETKDTQDALQMGVGFYHYIVNEEDELGLTKDLPTGRD
ncbi:MAG: DUF6502 family protein [Pseudomonadota bacterium]|nr:DUF6502 family protein [Pseudomonadota bacterium]